MSTAQTPPPTLTPLQAITPEEWRTEVAARREKVSVADPTRLLPDVDPRKIPRHIAIIMDGNGRWAQARGMHRAIGHQNGAKTVRAALETCVQLGIECLTLYSFSLENWKRPQDEVAQLMALYLQYMDSEREELVARNIQFRQIGRRDGLPGPALDALDRTIEATSRCTGTTLCLAVNYSSRDEITTAAQRVARKVAAGDLDPESITEETIESELFTAGLPDPDLLVRTAGEMRISNYLLWQISYAELYVTQTLWPDFDEPHLLEAVRAFAQRDRRFGGLTAPAST